MLVVVTSPSDTFPERPRKKAILGLDGVDDTLPAQVGERTVLLALRRRRFDRS